MVAYASPQTTMSNVPPIIPNLPPVIPPKKSRLPIVLILALGIPLLAFTGFLGYRVVQFVRYAREHPRLQSPGEAAFREANRQIIANNGTINFGNNREAQTLAADYAASLKILRNGFFTQGKKDAFSITKGDFLTYCHLETNTCVFLVHVPELRRFDGEAKKSLANLAWLNAQSVLKSKLTNPPPTIAVGIKGAVLYDAILIGDFISDPKDGDGVRTRGSGLEGTKLLHPFFGEESSPR